MVGVTITTLIASADTYLAWRVDFNLTVASFESNLKATRNLIDLSLTSPYDKAPRVVFIGSIGVIRSTFVFI